MRKILCFLVSFAILTLCFPSNTLALDLPSVSAKAAVVINGLTREVIYAKNKDERLSMASTTKIMTSLLLIENGDLSKEYNVSQKAASTEGSSIYLKSGDKITGDALLAGMMLESGNDAATATAEAVAGSVEAFADKMNERAREIGMKNTNFVTPSGLDAETHYSSAYDMAILTSEALKHKQFREISATVSKKVTFGGSEHTFTNHNKLITEYEGCIGVKTGYTRKSGRCLVSAALRDGKLIIAVTLSDPNDWEDHEKLLDYGMKEVEMCDITYGGGDLEAAVVGSDVTLVSLAVPKRLAGLSASEKQKINYKVELESFLYAPVYAGQEAGKVHYYYDDILIATDNLYVGGDISYSAKQENTEKDFWRCFRLLFSFFK